MNRVGLGRNAPCFCGSGTKYKKCCYPRTLPDYSQPNAGLPDPFEEQEAIYRAWTRPDAWSSHDQKVTFNSVVVGRTRLVCMPLPPYGDNVVLPGTMSPPTPLQVEAKYKAIQNSNPAGVAEVVLNYTYPEMFGFAEVRAVFDADDHFTLQSGDIISVLDLRHGMKVRMADDNLGTISGSPERRYEAPVPPLPHEKGLWTSRVTGQVKHTAYEIVEFRWAGQMVKATADHVIWSVSRQGWVGAGELNEGEMIRVAENNIAPVEGARRISGLIEVFGIEVEYFHNYFVGTGPNAMLVHNGPQCLNRPAVAEALEEGTIHETGRRSAGVLTEGELNPQHHIFPQSRRRWFAERGVDVDQYTARIPRDLHEALHSGGGPGRGGGWYNEETMKILRSREQALGRRLTPWEIEEHGIQFMERFGFGNAWVLPYGG